MFVIVQNVVGLADISALTTNVDLHTGGCWHWLYEYHTWESSHMPCIEEWVLALATNIG